MYLHLNTYLYLTTILALYARLVISFIIQHFHIPVASVEFSNFGLRVTSSN